MSPHFAWRRGLFAALVGAVCCSVALAQSPTPGPTPTRPRIERAADLPVRIYKVDGKVEDLVRSADRFAPFAAAVRRDTESLLADYDIADKATRSGLIGLLGTLDFLDGRYDGALRRLAELRALQDKPADKLMAGLRLEVMAQAAKTAAPGSEAWKAEVGRLLRQRLDAMPYDTIGNAAREANRSAGIASEALVVGGLRETVQPIVDRNGSISSDITPGLVGARFTLLHVLPLKAVLSRVYGDYLAAHRVAKADIWAARDVTLTPAQVKQPVVIGIWDSGVDLPLFGDRVLQRDGRPAVIAFDRFSNPAEGPLLPLPADAEVRRNELMARQKGFSDLQSNLDTPEAAEVRTFLSGLTPERYKVAIEELSMAGNYAHGTHVAGIAVAGNPGAKLAVGRISFQHTLQPDPCPSDELAARDAKATQAYVDYFRSVGARVVNMSWGGSVGDIEEELEKCGIGADGAARKALARRYFDQQKASLERAFASAPGILFVTAAGNSNNDASFTEDIPAGIVAPNLLTVGAVDSAGEEASFTSYGPTVKAHANGYQVPSVVPGGMTIAFSGTSMASPNAANLAAKMLAVNPSLTPEDLIRLIVQTATATSDGRRHLIDPRRAVATAGGQVLPASPVAATLPGPAFPAYATPAALTAACDAGLAATRARLRALEQRPGDDRWLAAVDAQVGYAEDQAGPFYVLENLHPDKAMRTAAEACTLKWADYDSSFGQNEALFRALQQVQPKDGIDREALLQLRESFEDSGVSLEPAKRARAKQISDRLTELGQTFDRNIRDADVKLPFTVEELKGVPESVWKDKPRDAQGRVLLGLDYPTSGPVMDLADSAAARERMWRARQNEGGEANLNLLAEIATLRREFAALFGEPSYGAFMLRRRMVGSPATARAFLDDVRAALVQRELRDLAELRAAKSRQLGTPLAQTTLDRWDVSYYVERVRRESYAVDQDAFRAYFPPEESMRFVMRTIERMMGVRYVQVPVAVWHPDVRAYAVQDAATGRALATLYIDLYPRDGKYGHAAVMSYRNGSTLTGRTPQAVLMVNMDRNGLSLDELETLLHEMGHAVHNNLSQTRYALAGGTGVQHDFVEAPSQMLEDWVYDPTVLKLFSEVCPACKPVPDAMIAKARVARDFAKGIRESRQQLFASYDLALYDAAPQDPMALWARMEGATPLGFVPGTMFPAGFAHIASNYGAGYYGYLWSKAIALDLRTAFDGHRLDPVVGKRYRDTILSQGRQAPPKDLVKAFLGRDTNTQAFFADLAR